LRFQWPGWPGVRRELGGLGVVGSEKPRRRPAGRIRQHAWLGVVAADQPRNGFSRRKPLVFVSPERVANGPT